MAKQLVRNVAFNAAAKTVTLTDYTTLYLERLLLIVDATHTQILYSVTDTSLGATVAGNVVTLVGASMAGLANGDALMVIYDSYTGDPVQSTAIIGGKDASGNQQGMSVVPGDAGQNAQVTAGARKEVTFTTTTAQALAGTDVSNYRWVSVQLTSQGTSSSAAFQASNDGVNWVTVQLFPSSITASSGISVVSATAVNGIWHGPIGHRYFRVNVTGISAGTTAGLVEFFAQPAAVFASTSTVVGAGAEAGAVAGNPLRVSGSDGTNNRTLKTDTSGNQTAIPTAASGFAGTSFRFLSAANTTGQVVKGGAGTLYAANLSNTSAAARYVKLYNKATAPTVGTDTPTHTYLIPAGATVPLQLGSAGVAFAAGIGLGITTGVGDSDATAPAANDVLVNLVYA